MTALAAGCHPYDIEMMMSGTLFLLRRAGWDVHYVNIADGCQGSDREPPRPLAARRREEAREAAALLGAAWHGSFVPDLEVFHEPALIRRVLDLVREVSGSLRMFGALFV